MSKPRVERAPEFELTSETFAEFSPFIIKYDSTDEKGRYLHWDQLRWRVPKEDAKNIWKAIKFKRSLQLKFVNLLDDKKKIFSYCTTHSMEAKLHRVANVAGGSVATVADNIATDNIQRKFLVSSLIMEEAITSAQLEGAATTREVAKKMLEEGREPVDDDERMILNNFFLLKYAEKMSKEPLTVDCILEFHRIATKGSTENNVVPGEFRQDNDIFVEDDRGEIVHQPPSFELIPKRLQGLCNFANENHSGEEGNTFITPVVKAIILHFMLGFEHPFRDGNGRTARALFYWYMLKHDYDLFKYISISKLLKNDPKGYGLSYLYTEKDNNDLTYFIEFQLDVILNAFDDLQQYLKDKTDEFYQVMDTLSNSSYSDLLNFIQKDLIKKGTKEPGRVFTVKEVSSSYETSQNTARSYLNTLVDLDLLLRTKDGKTVLYFAPSDLQERLCKKA